MHGNTRQRKGRGAKKLPQGRQQEINRMRQTLKENLNEEEQQN